MYNEKFESTKLGGGAKAALALCVMTLFGYFCYTTGYTQGRTTEAGENWQTTRAVAEAMNRLAQEGTEEQS